MKHTETHPMKGALIGHGLCAEVFAWGSDQVLKLFFDWAKPDWVRHEAEVGAIVHEAGIPAPAVYGIVEENGRHGILYQKINGKSMLSLMEANPRLIVHYMKQLARIQAEIHKVRAPWIPGQKGFLTDAIQESAPLLQDRTEKIIKFLERLPDDTQVCHGDFHPDNIIMAEEKAFVIDWSNASSGNALGDVARTYLMLNSPYVPGNHLSGEKLLLKAFKKFMTATYLREYRRLTKTKQKDIDIWILPLAAARLREKVPGEEKWLLSLIDKLI